MEGSIWQNKSIWVELRRSRVHHPIQEKMVASLTASVPLTSLCWPFKLPIAPIYLWCLSIALQCCTQCHVHYSVVCVASLSVFSSQDSQLDWTVPSWNSALLIVPSWVGNLHWWQLTESKRLWRDLPKQAEWSRAERRQGKPNHHVFPSSDRSRPSKQRIGWWGQKIYIHTVFTVGMAVQDEGGSPKNNSFWKTEKKHPLPPKKRKKEAVNYENQETCTRQMTIVQEWIGLSKYQRQAIDNKLMIAKPTKSLTWTIWCRLHMIIHGPHSRQIEGSY